MRRVRAFVLAAAIASVAGCAGIIPGGTSSPEGDSTAAQAAASRPQPDAELVPAGYGSLRQDDIAVRIALPAVNVRALPLDESIIRVLSPDSYRSLRELRQANRAAIERIAARADVRSPGLWYVSFFGLEPDARFSPLEMVITSGGREHRALDLVPLSPGFGAQRLQQRETQSAIIVFDDGINVNQPLTISIEGVQNASWGGVLRSVERERSLIRTRAAQAQAGER
ncbi:MAG TPA: hypothetical protein VFK13_01735 [Gemmatimonadaceae bacterium]|nr:hypothetical protein [Gemmatimonadaceae bacterium]